jgi:hypothetical protein
MVRRVGAWARETATDSDVHAALAVIAEDESRHAALAFRFLAWAARRDARVLPLVEHRFEEAVRSGRREVCPLPTSSPKMAPALASHGVLDAATSRAARRAGLFDVLPTVISALHAAASPEPRYAWKHGEARRFLG